jgi:hypothetical protein
MLRCSRLTRTALLSATLVRRAAVAPTENNVVTETAKPDAAAKLHEPASSLQHSKEASNTTSPHLTSDTAPQLHPHQRQPAFFFKGRRGSISPEYYSTRSNAGHPDAVAELLGAGRDDPEWMWLKLLCFLCTMATFGTTLYGYFFAEHVKYFKDEPWSPFTY